jgi:hypothetical protein
VNLAKVVKPISDAKAADLIRKIQIAIQIHNDLSNNALSYEEFLQEMEEVLRLVIPTAAEIALPFTWLIAGQKMALAGTGASEIDQEEILATLHEPERHRAFYPETVRAGARAMIQLTQPFWPSKLAEILDASLGQLDAGKASKMLTPAAREVRKGKGSLPDRQRLALCVACEVAFQRSANPNWSHERAIHSVTGQTRTGYDLEPKKLPPLIPLPLMSWQSIVNGKYGLLALARKLYHRELEEAAEAGKMVAAGKQEQFQRTEFAHIRTRYLQFTPEAWAALGARATGKDPKAGCLLSPGGQVPGSQRDQSCQQLCSTMRASQ